MKNNNTDQQSNQKNPSLLDSTKPFAKPIAKLGVGAGGATAAALLIAGPIGIIIAALIAAFALYSAGKDVKEIYDSKKEIYDSKNAKNVLNNLNGEEIGKAAKDLIENSTISSAIESYNEANPENQINKTTIKSFGNDPELQENFQKIINHYQNNPPSAISLGNTLRDVYNQNCEEAKKLGFFDFKALEDPIKLFNNLKTDSQDKFVGLVALIANNPKIIDEFAKDPSQINDLMKKCKQDEGNIDLIKGEIEKKLGKDKDSQEQDNTNTLDSQKIKDLLNETSSQEVNNKGLPNTNNTNNTIQKAARS